MKFDWQNSNDEIKELRTHNTKHYPHPTKLTERICIVSSGIFHAFTDKGFQDIEKELLNYNFPEGKRIEKPAEKEFHEIMELPEWGDARVEDGGKTVRVYDKKGISIFRYKDLLAVPKDEKPYLILDKDGKKIKNIKNKSELTSLNGEKAIENTKAIHGVFQIIDKKLCVKFDKAIDAIDVYDDTDTTSTNDGDTYCTTEYPTSNFSTTTTMFTDSTYRRAFIKFTLPSGAGIITDVKMYLKLDGYQAATGTLAVRETTSAIDITTVTWNTRPSESGTAIDSIPRKNYSGWQYWCLEGAEADNPLDLDWNDPISLVITSNVDEYDEWLTKETGTSGNRPYLLITYTPSGPANLKTANGLAKASVKTINGLAIASVKTKNGLA